MRNKKLQLHWNQAGFSEVQQWISLFEEYWKAQFKSLEDYLADNVPVPKK